MKEEIRLHLEQAEERLIARGMSPDEARYAARREFGNVAALEEDGRDARGLRIVESIIADTRFAFRYFARKPLTTVTIVLVLALGIGANTALFSILQSFTMRPAVGVPNDKSHVRIWAIEQKSRGARRELSEFSWPELQLLTARKETFRDVAGWTWAEVIVQAPERSFLRPLRAEFVTPNYWRTLGVPVTGPGFASPDGSADFAAVLSYALAGDVFGDATRAVGEKLIINDVPVRVVGVAPPRFEGAIPENGRPQIWLPVSSRAEVTRSSPRWLDEHRFEVFARLAPSITLGQATASTRELPMRVLPDSIARSGVIRTVQVEPLRGAPPVLHLDDEDLIGVAAIGLMGILILLVTCTNVSALLVASAVGRRHEIAVRLALGASRVRVLRQLLTESALLAMTGATVGLLVCWVILTIASKLENADLAPDLVTVGFTLAFAIGTGMIFGLSPALHATRTEVATALKDSGKGASGSSRLQRVFVVSQIVFSQPMLVFIAVLLVVIVNDRADMPRSVMERTIRAQFRPLTEMVAANRSRDVVSALVLEIGRQPAVEAVVPEPGGWYGMMTLTVPSADTAMKPVQTLVEGAAPGYFGMVDIPIVLGRDVSLADTNASDYPVVIGTDLARRIWGTASPIGKRLPATTGWGDSNIRDSAEVTIVGVVDAVAATERQKGTRVFTARGGRWRRDAMLVRTRGPARSYMPELRKLIQSNAPALPITQLATLEDIDREERGDQIRLLSAATGAAALALFLASIGLFAVIALAVGQRTREIGIRIALGAKPMRVARMFFLSGLRLSAIGLLIGLPITIIALDVALKRGIILATNYFSAPLAGLAIALVVLAVASAATWFPARKAAIVDPALALRAE